MSTSQVVKTILRGLEIQSPAILLALGIGGIATTGILASRGARKATYALVDEGERRYRDDTDRSPITSADAFKLTWKYYIPAIVAGIGTAACFVGAHSINVRRTAALATLYTATEAAFVAYKDKVVETIGEAKEDKIHQAIIQEELNNNPSSKAGIVHTGKGESLFYDSWSGRYFKTDMQKVRKAQNDLNAQLLSGGLYTSLNDLYDELGLEHIKGGENIGWSLDGIMELKFSSKIADNDEPCIVIEYKLQPKQFK